MKSSDLLAQIVRAREALEDGELLLVEALLECLEIELADSHHEPAGASTNG